MLRVASCRPFGPIFMQPPAALGGLLQPAPAAMASQVTASSQSRGYAHWYSGRKLRHRYIRDLRFNPRFSVANMGRNRYSKRLHYKTNRWNYKLAYKDTP
uniref:Uncharacterized protein n=1 Tax=Neobodo designis TaxID=312471 RepID=A0A7S1QVJ6_NEODS